MANSPEIIWIKREKSRTKTGWYKHIELEKQKCSGQGK
jgi:hypothetical protein